MRVSGAVSTTDQHADFLARMLERITRLEGNRARTGVVGWTTATASSWSNATGTESDISASSGSAPSLTLALDPAHRYRMVFTGRFSSSVDGDVVSVRLVEGGVQRQAALARLLSTVAVTVHHEVLFNPASAAVTVYKIVGARVGGSGTVSLAASATTPASMWIEYVD